MLLELWNNKWAIFNNYLRILKSCQAALFTIFIIFGLIVIYAYMRYQEYCRKQIAILNSGVEQAPPIVLELFESGSTVGSKILLHPNTTTKVSLSHPNGVYDNLRLDGTSPSPGNSLSFSYNNTPASLYNYCQDHYLSKFNQTNIQARGFDTRSELERTYKHLIIPISPSMQESVSTRLSTALKAKVNPAKLDILKPWISRSSISNGAKWLEAGMPHTHDNTMIMHAGWFSNINCETYVHELFHIIQRHRPDAFTRLYTSPAWNYKYIGLNNLIGLEVPIQLARMNPDATDFGWIWTEPATGKHYWINAIFTSSAPSKLTDVKYFAYPLIQQPGNKFRYIGTQPVELKDLSGFVNSFGIGYNHYHPNEIASQYAEYYFCQSPENNNIKNKSAYQEFASWISSSQLD